jgi:hypothetical protein
VLPRESALWAKRIVIVPAVWREWDAGLPAWARSNEAHPWTVYTYQRHDPAKPLFAPNYGYEGAIYLRFIVDHYEGLLDGVYPSRQKIRTASGWLGCGASAN